MDAGRAKRIRPIEWTAFAAILISLLCMFLLAGCEPGPDDREAAVAECTLTAYVAAPEGIVIEGLSESIELTRLPSGAIVTVSGVSAGRLRISRAVSIEEEILFTSPASGPGDGWIPAGFVVIATEPLKTEREINGQSGDAEVLSASEAGTVPLYKDPAVTGDPVAKLAPYDAVNVLGCRADWAYIEATTPDGDPARGWLAPDAQCGNPVSSCS